MHPLISICIPALMRSGYRLEFLTRSINSALSQAYVPLQIVVVNDGADLALRELLGGIEDPRLVYLETPSPSGYGPAWNKAVSASIGTYFLLLADDDWLEEGAISVLAEFLDRHPQVGFVYGDFDLVDRESERVLSTWRSHKGYFIKNGLRAFPKYILGTKGCLQATLWRRRIFDQVGGFDDAGNPSDNSLYLKFLRVSDVGHVDRKICNYSIRISVPDGEDRQLRNVEEDALLLDRYFDKWPYEILQVRDRTVSRMRKSLARKAFLLAAESKSAEIKIRAEKVARGLDNSLSSGVYRTLLFYGGKPLLKIGFLLNSAIREMMRKVLYVINKQVRESLGQKSSG